MKKTIVQNCCDLCTRPSTCIEKCLICKKDYCLLCRWSGIFSIPICKVCGRTNPKVVAILKRYLNTWRRYNTRIEAELAKVKPVRVNVLDC
jgi:hypothetical protein